MSDMKPVKCGCGGDAYAHLIGNTEATGYYICCEECGTKTAIFDTLKGASDAWEKAIGKEKDCAHCVSYDKVKGYCNNYGLWIGDAFGCKDFAPYCEVNNE